ISGAGPGSNPEPTQLSRILRAAESHVCSLPNIESRHHVLPPGTPSPARNWHSIRHDRAAALEHWREHGYALFIEGARRVAAATPVLVGGPSAADFKQLAQAPDSRRPFRP